MVDSKDIQSMRAGQGKSLENCLACGCLVEWRGVVSFDGQEETTKCFNYSDYLFSLDFTNSIFILQINIHSRKHCSWVKKKTCTQEEYQKKENKEVTLNIDQASVFLGIFGFPTLSRKIHPHLHEHSNIMLLFSRHLLLLWNLLTRATMCQF